MRALQWWRSCRLNKPRSFRRSFAADPHGHAIRWRASLVIGDSQRLIGRVALDQKQLQLKAAEGKIAELKVKLNQANTNREYQALKDQIAADEMACSVLADEILEAMEKLDVMKAQIPESEGRVAKAKEELGKIQQQIRAEEESLRADVKRLEKELAEAETALPEDFRAMYQRVVKAKGEDAMAVVEGGSCGGCFQQLTTNMHNEINMGRVVLCKSCGRVLYLPEDTRHG